MDLRLEKLRIENVELSMLLASLGAFFFNESGYFLNPLIRRFDLLNSKIFF